MIILGCFGVPPFTETPKWLKWLINGVYLLLTNWDIGMILQAHPWRLTWLAMDNEPKLKMYFPRYMWIFCRYFSLPEAHKRNTKPHWTELLKNICEQNWFETSWFWSWKWLPPWKLTQISKIAIERRYGTFFQTIILGIYVKFPGCIYILYFSYKTFWGSSWGYLESTPLRKRCRKSRVPGKVLNLSTQQRWFQLAVGWVT